MLKWLDFEIKEPVSTRVLYVLFVLAGLFLCVPCKCRAGFIAAQFRMVFFALINIRLIYGLIKKNIKTKDVGIYGLIFLVFTIMSWVAMGISGH